MGWNFVRILALIPMALAIGAMSASAAPILVTFDNDPIGLIPGTEFTSDDSTQIHFIDTDTQSLIQGDMFIGNAPFTNNSNALAVFFDGTIVEPDYSKLQIVFDLPATSISMDLFSGPNFSPELGDTAVLTAFMDTVEVGNVSVDLVAQAIFFDCVLFDCGTFDRFDTVEVEFVVPGGLTEIVDNVSVNLIPEPHAAVVFGAGALLVGAACGRRGRT